jgi:hypothetical protein
MDDASAPADRTTARPLASYAMLKLQMDCYVEQDPFDKRRRSIMHLWVEPIGMSLLKNALMLGVRLTEAETPTDVPVDDARELGLFLYEKMRTPVTKDVLITAVTRLYEELWKRAFLPDVLTASKVLRGALRRVVSDAACGCRGVLGRV